MAEILLGCGYDQGTVDRVQEIVTKTGLRTDPEVQAHEDALCLVFLQTQLLDLAAQLGPDEAVEVLAKTVKKMTPRGRSEALELDLDPAGRAALEQALASVGSTPSGGA